MNRGKRQILFDYLPGKTFDFERVATIARVSSIRGVQISNFNPQIVLRKVAEDARAWSVEFRPSLRDDVLNDLHQFVLLDPKAVQAEIFPKVFWCNPGCGHVFDYTQRSTSLPETCPVCNSRRMIQLRWIKIHSCGAIEPLLPPKCQRCKTAQHMALDIRGSERISNFRWVCRNCTTRVALFGGRCRECGSDNMAIEVHRAGRTYYAHHAVVLNIPGRELDAFFNLPEAPLIAAAKIFGLPEVANFTLAELTPAAAVRQTDTDPGLSGPDLDDLFRRQSSGELSSEQMVEEIKKLREKRRSEQQAISPGGIVQALEQWTGVARDIWERAGQEMLEAIIPLEIRTIRNLYDSVGLDVAPVVRRMGISRLLLIEDFPIVTATYGFSRSEYKPNECRLRPFPQERDHGGRYPIYADQVQADALLLSLDPYRVCNWLERNGCVPTLPNGRDADQARRSHFVELFDGVIFGGTLGGDMAEVRMVFGLLHTLSHLCVRQAALLCGLDRTSLSEYLLPRTLSFALYCNHRFGATIGALTALFQQSMIEWLNAVFDTRKCVYDPVCRDREGSCHACTHLAETSCRVFNLNLNRAFLYGGNDPELGHIQVGYFDRSLT